MKRLGLAHFSTRFLPLWGPLLLSLAAEAATLRVSPPAIHLSTARDRQSLVVQVVEDGKKVILIQNTDGVVYQRLTAPGA